MMSRPRGPRWLCMTVLLVFLVTVETAFSHNVSLDITRRPDVFDPSLSFVLRFDNVTDDAPVRSATVFLTTASDLAPHSLRIHEEQACTVTEDSGVQEYQCRVEKFDAVNGTVYNVTKVMYYSGLLRVGVELDNVEPFVVYSERELGCCPYGTCNVTSESCAQDAECVTGWSGPECLDRCPCDRGSCPPTSSSCVCQPHFYGPDCSRMCKSSDCGPRSECGLQGQCVCLEDKVLGYWAGKDCKDCKEGWTGQNCTLQILDTPRPVLVRFAAIEVAEIVTTLLDLEEVRMAGIKNIQILNNTRLEIGNGQVNDVVFLLLDAEGRGNTVDEIVVARINTEQKIRGLILLQYATLGRLCPSYLEGTSVCNNLGYCDYQTGDCVCVVYRTGLTCELNAVPESSHLHAGFIIFGVGFLLLWLQGFGTKQYLWNNYERRQQKLGYPRPGQEIFLILSPLHRTHIGAMPFRIICLIYFWLCMVSAAFPKTSKWYPTAKEYGVAQVFHYARLNFGHPACFFIGLLLAAGSVLYTILMGQRLSFVVNLNYKAFHHNLDGEETQRICMNPMTWDKPRFRPMGYTHHWLLYIGDLIFPAILPMVMWSILEAYPCDKYANSAPVARIDPTLSCYGGAHVAYTISGAVFVAALYFAFLSASQLIVAGTEKLQKGNLERGLPSQIRSSRAAYFTICQFAVIVVIGDVFVSSVTSQLIPSFIVLALVTIGISIYYSTRSTCNIPLFGHFYIVAWNLLIFIFLMACLAQVISNSGLILDITLVGVVTGLVIGIAAVMGCYANSKGCLEDNKDGIPPWFAVRQKETQRRQQLEVDKLNQMKHMQKEDLDFDPDNLPTPRSIISRSRSTKRSNDKSKSWPDRPLSPSNLSLTESAKIRDELRDGLSALKNRGENGKDGQDIEMGSLRSSSHFAAPSTPELQARLNSGRPSNNFSTPELQERIEKSISLANNQSSQSLDLQATSPIIDADDDLSGRRLMMSQMSQMSQSVGGNCKQMQLPQMQQPSIPWTSYQQLQESKTTIDTSSPASPMSH